MHTRQTEANQRGCYCGLWQTNPQALKRQGIPPGYCAFCQVCAKPGHTRHFPGAVPYTGSWCDRHYQRAWLFHPLGSVGFFLWAGGILACILAGIAWWSLT